ncbi:MAG: DUF3618 domain-containing protein [Gammaproteobacteria bacterium]|jgi:hypothetical protein
MSARDERKSADIEKEIEQTRTRMDETLDALQEKLSPGQLVDQLLAYTKSGPGQYFSNLGHTVQQNPFPVALVGVGLGWLMMSGSKAEDRRRATKVRYPEEDYEADYDDDTDDYGLYDYDYEEEGTVAPDREVGIAGGYSGLEAGVSGEEDTLDRELRPSGLYVPPGAEKSGSAESEKSTTETVKESAGRMKEKAGEAAERTRERVGETAAAARERVRRATRAARRAGHRAGYRAGRQLNRASRGIEHFMREQPLVLGALGLAVGAALGAGLPATRREDTLMGSARDDLVRRGRQAGREQIDKGQRMATAARDAAVQEAQEQGLTQEAAEEQVRGAREKVEKVATAARTAAEEEANK